MRVFIILASIALAHGAKLERTYLPPSHAGTSGGSGNFLQTPNSGPSNAFTQNLPNGFKSGNELPQSNGFAQNDGYQNSDESHSEFNNVNGFNEFDSRPERAQAALERSAAILRQDNSNDGETYAYAFETENGIYAEENGVATNGVEAQGGYTYTGDDGQVYSVRYTADQNGFVPQGEHLPTPPPVPEEILKALEQNARDEAAGIYDDGSYSEGKYSNDENNQQNYQNSFNGYDDSVLTNSAFQNYPSGADSPRGNAFQNYPTADGPRGNTGPGSAGIEKTYLPPFASGTAGLAEQSGSSGFPRPNGSTGPSVEKTYLPPFATQGSSGSTGFPRPNGSAGVEKTYLPPFASQGAAGPSSSNGMRGPGSVQKTYLPPFAQGSGSASGIRGSPQKAYIPPFATSQGSSSALRAPGSVKKTYLPPSSAPQGNFGRRQQSFDSRNGYQY